MSKAPIILLAGPPAVGKSSVSRALAQIYPKLTHIEVDKIRESVISGYLMPDPSWPPEVMAQINLARLSVLDMAERYSAAGYVVVIDDFTDGEALAAYDDLLGDSRVTAWLLYPGVEATLARCRERGGELEEMLEGAIRYCYGELRQQVDEKLIAGGWRVIEDSRSTPAEIASTITKVYS